MDGVTAGKMLSDWIHRRCHSRTIPGTCVCEYHSLRGLRRHVIPLLYIQISRPFSSSYDVHVLNSQYRSWSTHLTYRISKSAFPVAVDKLVVLGGPDHWFLLVESHGQIQSAIYCVHLLTDDAGNKCARDVIRQYRLSSSRLR